MKIKITNIIQKELKEEKKKHYTKITNSQKNIIHLKGLFIKNSMCDSHSKCPHYFTTFAIIFKGDSPCSSTVFKEDSPISSHIQSKRERTKICLLYLKSNIHSSTTALYIGYILFEITCHKIQIQMNV